MALQYHRVKYETTTKGFKHLQSRTGTPDHWLESSPINRILSALVAGKKSARELVPFVPTRSRNPEYLIRTYIGRLQKLGCVRSIAVEPALDTVAEKRTAQQMGER